MQIIGTATLTPPLLGPPIRQAKPACADRFPPYMAAARIEGGGAQTRWGMGASLGCEPTVRAEPSSTRRGFVAFLSTGFCFFLRWRRSVRSSTRRPSPHLPSAAVAADRQVPRSLSMPTPMAPAERPFDRMDAQHLSPGGGGGLSQPGEISLTWWNLASVCRCRREGEGCRLSWVPPTRLLSNPSFRCIVQQGLFWLRLAPPMAEARLLFLIPAALAHWCFLARKQGKTCWNITAMLLSRRCPRVPPPTPKSHCGRPDEV